MQAKNKKWLTASTAAFVLAGLLSACNNSSNEGASSSSSAASPTASSEASSSAPKGEPVTLKVEVFDRGNAPAGAGPVTDNFWTQWIQEKFGDPNNIKLEFVAVPRSQEVEKLNVLMASNDAPDIVYTYSLETVNNYVTDGGIIDVGPLLDEFGPNLKEFLGDEVLSYGLFNGTQFTIPAKRPLQFMQTSYIRKDWLDKLGLPVPTTTDEFYNTLKAFKEKDPGQVGNKLIAYDFSALYSSPIANPSQLIHSFEEPVSEEDRYALSTGLNTPELMKPGYKEGVRFLNKMNADGLVNKDFALDKDGKNFESDVANGYVGSFTALAAHNSLMGQGQVFDTLKQNVPGAEYVAFDPFTDKEGHTPKQIYDPIGFHIMIPKTSKHAAEAIKYLNWMAQEDVLFTLQNGIENQHYTLENGFPKAITTDEAKKTFYNNSDIAIIANGKSFGTQEKDIEAAGLSFPGYEELAKQTVRNALKDGYTVPRFDKPIEAEIKSFATANEKAIETVVKSILVKPEKFDSVYEAGVKEYLKLGGQAIIDERRAAYQSISK